MANQMDLRKTIIATDEVLNVGSIINQALIEILIAKQIISEEDMIAGIRRIKEEQQLLLNDSNNIVPLKS